MGGYRISYRGRFQHDSHIELADVAARPEAAAICDELMGAAQEWLNYARMQLPHIDSAHRFAVAIPGIRATDRGLALAA